MNNLDTNNCIEMLSACLEDIKANVPLLCRLDSFVGDGDHGLTVSRGFEAAYAKVVQSGCASPYQVFNVFSKELGRSMGGAIGPIFQSIFLGMSNAIKESRSLGARELLDMQKKGLQSVMVIGGAKVGDRTLVDSFYPAAAAYEEAYGQGKNMHPCCGGGRGERLQRHGESCGEKGTGEIPGGEIQGPSGCRRHLHVSHI